MTTPKLLSNLPIEDLTSQTDYLGIIDKGDLIKTFLKGNKDQFDEIKMFSLYGEWGSGKSSLMKYLEKELKGDFNTFFFEAWEFEKDENLAMSLLEFITYKRKDTTEEFFDDILKYGGRILRGLGKSIKLNIPLFTNGPAIELDPSAFVEEVSKSEELTFYKALGNFKTEFIRLEDNITKGDNPKYNIVFIDDLDRCEPEQVLNLLSAIKLFFTYGCKTIFFCGVDKKAVGQAVKTKYGEIVIAHEYLEKIFDISFSMPEHDDLEKLINHYFDDTYYDIGDGKIAINHRINIFFKYLEFTNPRRIKKVLNKYQILRNIKFLQLPEKYYPFPNIDEKNAEERNYFETILVLYLIILHEFYPKYFDDFLDFDLKRKNYLQGFKNSDQIKDINSAIGNLNKWITINQSKKTLGNINLENNDLIAAYLICLAPSDVNQLSAASIWENSKINQMLVKGNKIEYLFFKFIIESNVMNYTKKNTSDSSLSSIKKIVKSAL
ncbi:KAP family P-loop NTPase fold protein [Flavobacterium sp. KACC 22763]|uniref:KAP family P-loop NTPase fold protein n=1 Tax=Flavobacterium sp. KACC 22763 TaxID=3025668 RepID=UPI002366E7E7|nr:P-loop NTPase fold protein [Flavobacterium sp. KACC 22763]WDF64103.1 P-loop NTPase fold protein [Flavobacterium sp. KACC 22763]